MNRLAHAIAFGRVVTPMISRSLIQFLRNSGRIVDRMKNQDASISPRLSRISAPMAVGNIENLSESADLNTSYVNTLLVYPIRRSFFGHM
jgi:hypothetical protein